MLPTITLRQLGFLVALADTLSFSRAAEVSLVTQPSLSAALKELEDRLGVMLAERTRRSVILTPIGAEIAEKARTLLLAAHEIEDLAKASAAPDTGILRLGAIPTIGPFLIPHALPEIRTAFPGLKLLLREEMTEHLLDGLQNGRLDLILFALPFETGGLEVMELFEDGYHLAAPVGSFGPEPVHGAELEGSRLMLLEKGHCLQRHALSAYPERDIEQDESFSATSLATLISMVGEGLGITLLPDLAIDGGVLGGQEVAVVPLPDARPRKIVLAWRASSPRAELFGKLGTILIRTRQGMDMQA